MLSAGAAKPTGGFGEEEVRGKKKTTREGLSSRLTAL